MSYTRNLLKLDRELVRRGLNKGGIPFEGGQYDLGAIRERIRDHDREHGRPESPGLAPSPLTQQGRRRATTLVVIAAVMVLLMAVGVAAFLALA